MTDNINNNTNNNNKIIPKEGTKRKKVTHNKLFKCAYYVKQVAKVLISAKYKTRHDITAI
jgi:hypothetical protein